MESGCFTVKYWYFPLKNRSKGCSNTFISGMVRVTKSRAPMPPLGHKDPDKASLDHFEMTSCNLYSREDLLSYLLCIRRLRWSLMMGCWIAATKRDGMDPTCEDQRHFLKCTNSNNIMCLFRLPLYTHDNGISWIYFCYPFWLSSVLQEKEKNVLQDMKLRMSWGVSQSEIY